MSLSIPRRPVELISRLSSFSIGSYPAPIIESIKRGAIYEICVEILRTHMAAGKKALDDVCIAHLGAGSFDSDALEFAAAVAISRPTMDYDELLSYAMTLREERDIRNNLYTIIEKFDYRPAFYHYFIAQESHDSLMVRTFDRDDTSAALDIAIHGDLAAMRRLAKITAFKDEKTMIGRTLAHFPYDESMRTRLKLTNSATMSNFEFTSRMDKFFSQKAGLTLGSDGKETVKVYTAQEMMNLPDFDAKMAKNAGTVVNLFYRAVRAAGGGDSAQALESVENLIIAPLLKDPKQRVALFFSQALSKDESWIADVMESDDGGRSYYLQMLIDFVARDRTQAMGVARAFVRLEPIEDLLALSPRDDALATLHQITSNKAFLQEVSPKGRDKAFGGDLGL